MKKKGQHLQLTQDDASSRVSVETTQELHERHIFPICWPSFSPDLNPIEMVGNWMKDWIQDKYPDDKQLPPDKLQSVVLAAWDAIPDKFLENLMKSMQARCQAVMDAEGGHTPY